MEIRKYNAYTIPEYFRQQGAQIGEDCYISISDLGSEPYLVKLGNHVSLAIGVRLVTHDLCRIYRDRIPDLQSFGKIVIEDNCQIAAGAIILPNVTIGRNSMIAAGSVVAHDIPPDSIAAGVPAKVIGNIEQYFEKTRAIWAEQKPRGYMAELIPGEYYSQAYLDQLRAKPVNRKLLRKHLTQIFWGEGR